IRGRLTQIRALFEALSPSARRRFLRRLILLRGEEARAFWAEMLAVDGPLSTLESISDNAELFRFAATAAGTQVGPHLLNLLRRASVADRLAIKGERRRHLFHAVEQLLFREETSEIGIWCLAMLAEAENEDWANNSVGVFREVFFPLHEQMPLLLAR